MNITNLGSTKSKISYAIGALVALSIATVSIASIIAPSSAGAASGSVPTNDPSNIITGSSQLTPTTIYNDYVAKTPSDIQSIYGYFGLKTTADAANFKAKAVSGTLNSDGTLTVNGKVVADSAKAVGRLGASAGYKDTTPFTISGKTYYYTPVSYILSYYKASSTNAYVTMDSNNHPQVVIMADCGNPVAVNTPQYSCKSLNATKKSDSVYDFTTNVLAQNGATLTKVTYDFGDKTPTDTETSASKVVEHTYKTPGDYTAQVTVVFTYHGQTFTVVDVTHCSTKISIPAPKGSAANYVCSNITYTNSGDTYTFTATGTPTGNATLVSGTFDFGDQTSVSGVKPSGTNAVTAPAHTYTPGNYSVRATVVSTVGSNTNNYCVIPISISQTTTTSPSTPTQVPSTGPSDLFGSAIGLSSIVGAGTHYVRTRRDVLRAFLRRR